MEELKEVISLIENKIEKNNKELEPYEGCDLRNVDNFDFKNKHTSGRVRNLLVENKVLNNLLNEIRFFKKKETTVPVEETIKKDNSGAFKDAVLEYCDKKINEIDKELNQGNVVKIIHIEKRAEQRAYCNVANSLNFIKKALKD